MMVIMKLRGEHDWKMIPRMIVLSLKGQPTIPKPRHLQLGCHDDNANPYNNKRQFDKIFYLL